MGGMCGTVGHPRVLGLSSQKGRIPHDDGFEVQPLLIFSRTNSSNYSSSFRVSPLDKERETTKNESELKDWILAAVIS